MQIIKKIHLWSARVILAVIGIPLLLVTLTTGGFGLTVFLNTPLLIILLIGLYLKATYRYIWNTTGREGRRALISFGILASTMLWGLVGEIINPSLRGPMMWAIVDRPIDYPSMWFDNWRLWWVTMIAEGALFKSVIILYAIIIIRWIYNLRRNKQSQQATHGEK